MYFIKYEGQYLRETPYETTLTDVRDEATRYTYPDLDFFKTNFPNLEIVSCLEDYHNISRSQMPDWRLINGFKTVRYQHKYGYRSDKTMIEYINELEFRNIKYRV